MNAISFILTAALAANGQIAFLAGTEQEDRCVHVVDLASGDVQRVGVGERDGAPAWSPQGDRIAFAAQYPDGRGIFVAAYPGGTPERIPALGTSNFQPRWSPDGSKIAYQAGGLQDAYPEVAEVGTDTITRYGGKTSGILRPVWESDDQLVAVGLVGLPGKTTSTVFRVTKGGAEPIDRTPNPYTVWAAEPNETQEAIAYESNDGGDREIFVYTPRSGAIDVSNDRAADFNPVWSPDGQWIAFESFRGGTRGVYRVKPAQLLVKPVAADAAFNNWSPAWSPDMRHMAFITDRTGSPKLAITEIENGETTVYDTIPGDHAAPAWRPAENN